MRQATHFLTMGGGRSHLRPIATNTPKGCSCGRCGSHVRNVPETERRPTALEAIVRRGRRETDAELIATRKRFLTQAQSETGAARRASIGMARDIADVLAARGADPFGFVEDVLAGPADSGVGDG